MHSALQVLPAELSVLDVLGLEQCYPVSPVGLVKGDSRCRCNNASQVTLPATFCVKEGL